jgi:small multidrug resistance family-3 protein
VYSVILVSLSVLAAIAEIADCHLPYLWLRQGKSAWLLVPGAVSLARFARLLRLHPTAAGRTYAAYGGVYVSVAVFWLWWIDGVRPDRWDTVGAAVTLIGMSIIAFVPHVR